MNALDFYGNFNQVANFLQSLAIKLTGDRMTARVLYTETVYRAEKRSVDFNERNSFKDWIASIMTNIFYNKDCGS